ncbi:muscle M-line assembly protein unc-89 isoform X2 [Tribolium madens]|uniref:muscle M-line assembly protein unc-89 isoform X2 n=1 Tax=Tribolium madens TaxID=41895 RepID=UPI001CF72F04|nr:muscle M-line assembly protein unc-89 isoform X2 [Tribolium madens]
MGNTHAKPHPKPRNKKQVHWKAADRPSPPGKPHLSDNDLTPDLVTIAWSKPIRDGGSPITGYLVEHRRTGSPHWVRATPLLVPFPELTLSGLEPGWRYQFRVRAENGVGLSEPSDISEPLTVTLQKFAITAPKFTEELKDATALENDKVEFVVHFLGQPAPKICWFKDGFEIFSSRRTRILTENDRSVLTIHQSALADEGEIKCTATNKAGHASTKARLTLEAPPSIRLPRQYEDGLLFEIGEVIRLKVSVAGRPTPLVFWSHDGESIQNNDRYEIEYVDKCSVLKIAEATRGDRGEYQIKAVNKIGEDLASFLVTITDKPSPPGRARVVMTLGRSVTLSWSTPDDDGGCKIGNYIVEYYRLGWNVWLKAATSRQLTTILGDLIEGSEYKFRVKAESPYGISEPGDESDIVFIPDPKRGITSPQARSQSQPKDIIDEITSVPIAAKRRPKPRSQSSIAKAEAFTNYYDETPKRPERNKIKSPPKTPEASPSPVRKDVSPQTILDRASLARDLAYGSPELKMKKTEELLQPTFGKNLPEKTNSPLALETKSPSPPKSRTPSPNFTPEDKSKTPSPKDKRSLLREKSEESSEFMLVLYPDANEKGRRRSSQNFEFDFNEFDIPPPLSLSAPELGAEPPVFENLKTSASSTELLHERAMMRFNEAAAAEEEDLKKRRRFSYDGQHNIEIPKIQINSKDDQDIVGLERKPSRRKSSGSVVQQQLLWAQKRFSLKNSNDLNEFIETKLQKLPRQNSDTDTPKKEMIRQRSESEEREEEEFNRVRAQMGLQGQSSFEKRSIEVVDEDKWLEDYEESLSESETESEDERDFDIQPPTRIYSDEEETYHPGAMTTPRKPSVSDEPFEILTKRNKLPDPNFVPKPILKKTEDKVEPPKQVPSTKVRSHSPMPQFRQEVTRGRSQSLAQPPLELSNGKNKIFQRSISLVADENTEPEKISPTLQAAPGRNISAVATLCGITAASIVIPEKLLQKKNDEEESKVVVDHYMDIVRSYGQRKKSNPQIMPQSWRETEEMKPEVKTWSTTNEENKGEVDIERSYSQRKKSNPQILPQSWGEAEATKIWSTTNEEQGEQPMKSQEIESPPKTPPPERSPSPQKAPPSQQRGRTINHKPRRASSRSKTPSRSPSRLENWSGRSQRKTSPSPVKRKTSPSPMKVRKSPSPIPLAKPRPKLREIMTQTSIGLELNYSSDSRASTPHDRRQEELLAKAEVKVRSFVDYLTDLAMFFVACWLYLFSNELLAIPVLLVMVYRQLKNEIGRRIPRWIVRRFNKKKAKKS